MKVYLVGGAVRDMMLGLNPKDRDFVVVGSSIEEMEARGFQKVGADFPVFLDPNTGEEYALARTEKKTGIGYLGFDTRFTPDVTIEQDLARRDLTINAMALDEETGTLVDPYGGFQDLQNRILRHTSGAFIEDPLRVLRLARFCARFPSFTVDQSTVNYVKQMIEEGMLEELTTERVFIEFSKGLSENNPSLMYKFLEMVGARNLNQHFLPNDVSRYGALDSAAQNGEDLAVLFAITASNFRSKTHFASAAIPSHLAEVATIVNNELGFITNYRSYSYEERAMLFNRVDLYRRQGRFEHALTAIGYILVSKNLDLPIEIYRDMNAALSVKYDQIKDSIKDPSKIQETFLRERIKRMTLNS